MAGPRQPQALAAAPTPIALDTLLSRAAGPAEQPHTRRPPRHGFAPSASVRPAAPRPDVPEALVLTITVSTCQSCGNVTRHAAAHVHVRYAVNAHTVHYRREDITRDDALTALPRQRRELHVPTPFCDNCF